MQDAIQQTKTTWYPNTFQITPWKVLDYSFSNKPSPNTDEQVRIIKHPLLFYGYSNCVQLLCYQGFFTSGRSHPPSIFLIPPHFTSSFPTHPLVFLPLPRDSTGENLGLCHNTKTRPLFTTTAHYIVVIIYVHWCIKTDKAENDRVFVRQAAVT